MTDDNLERELKLRPDEPGVRDAVHERGDLVIDRVDQNPRARLAVLGPPEPAPDGTIYVVHRCFENSCAGRPEAPILKYSAAGKLLASFGQGQLIFPHGGTVDRDGNLWMTDAGSAPGKGHQAIKFSPDGKIVMTLGKAGVSGSGPGLFDLPLPAVGH